MRRSTHTALAALLSLLALAPAAHARLPRGFFGIAPQTGLTTGDAVRMRHGGLHTVRLGLSWPQVQPSPRSGYDWSAFDEVVATAARARLELLPGLYGTPHWLSGRETNLPVATPRQRRAWGAFVRSAVERYGRHGDFWAEHDRASGAYVPRLPIRRWQIWNEENFHYFTTPVSPGRYATLLKISHRAVRSADPRAEVILGGLFGEPRGRPPRAMDATDFLGRLYGVRGIRGAFEGVALHPYARDVPTLAVLVNSLRDVLLRHRDARTGLYVTEMGWGSQHDPRRVAFEVGWRAQARELRSAYRYLIGHRHRLELQQVDWFTWKDVRGACSFCDSSGLFRRGRRYRPKPAWHAMVAVAHGHLG